MGGFQWPALSWCSGMTKNGNIFRASSNKIYNDESWNNQSVIVHLFYQFYSRFHDSIKMIDTLKPTMIIYYFFMFFFCASNYLICIAISKDNIDSWYSAPFQVRVTTEGISAWKYQISTIVALNNYIDGLVQHCSISIAKAMEILQSCTKPLIYH